MPLREYYIGVYLEQVRVGLQSGMRPDFDHLKSQGRHKPWLKSRQHLQRHKGHKAAGSLQVLQRLLESRWQQRPLDASLDAQSLHEEVVLLDTRCGDLQLMAMAPQ